MATIYRNRKLIYIGVVLFFFFSGIGCITPFLTLHMRHLGFTLPEVSMINTVSAFISLLGPVLGGTFAERHSKHKLISVICILVAAFAYSAMTFIPRYEKLLYRPLVDFSCVSGIRIERCVNWHSCQDALSPFGNLTTIQLTGCHYQCPTGSHLNTSHPLHVCFHGVGGNICVVYESNGANNSEATFDTQFKSWEFHEDAKEETLELNGTLALYEYDENDENGEIDKDGDMDKDEEVDKDGQSDKDEVSRAQVSMCNYLPSSPISFNKKTFHSISCRPEMDDCNIHCQTSFSHHGLSVLPRPCEEATGDPSSTFWTYLFLRCLGDLGLLTAICVLDSLAVSSTSDYDGAYGRLHFLPALGMAIFSPFSGALLDQYHDMGGKADFSPPALMAAGFAVLTCVLIIALPIVCRKNFPQFQYLPGSVQSSFFSFEMVILLIIVLVLGIQWSIIYTFLSWMTHDIGCSGMQTGLACTVAFGFSLPFLLISKNMMRNIGRANLLVFALLFYGTRYAGVSFVLIPWWTMPFAAMDTFTLCVMWMSAVAYGQYLSPPGYHLVTQYTLNVLHFGIGRGFGSLLGGAFISQFGLRETFRGVAVWSAVIGLLYLGFYHLVIRRYKSSRKSGFPVLLNASWYPLRERQSNGDTKAHQPIVVDQDDDVSSPGGRPAFRK